jgi:hypothetical protein
MLKDTLLKSVFGQEIVEANGIEFIARELTSGDAVKYESSLYSIVNGQPVLKMENSKAKLISLALYDKDGNKVFTDKDIEIINSLPAKLVNKLFEACSKVNGIGTEKN